MKGSADKHERKKLKKKHIIWLLVSLNFDHKLNLSRFKQYQIMSCMTTHTTIIFYEKWEKVKKTLPLNYTLPQITTSISS
jgi:hypothetical protein